MTILIIILFLCALIVADILTYNQLEKPMTQEDKIQFLVINLLAIVAMIVACYYSAYP
jgi:uncharacterized membrane protein YidH (DUF202 family)